MAITLVSSLKFGAVEIMQQNVERREKQKNIPKSASDAIVQSAHDNAPSAAKEQTGYDKIRNKLAGAEVFDSSRITKQELKIKFFKEVAKAFGFDLDEGGEDLKNMANKLSAAMRDMKQNDPAAYHELLDKLAKKLGLDKLGIDVEDIVSAFADPTSDAARKVDRALDAAMNSDTQDQVMKLIQKFQQTIVDDPDVGTYLPNSFPPARF